MQLAELLGRVRLRFLPDSGSFPTPSRRTLQKFLGPLSREAVRRLRVDFAGKAERRRLMEEMLRSGWYQPLTSLVKWERVERILDPLAAGQPVVAVTWHAGPFAALGVGILELNQPTTLLVSHAEQFAPSDLWESLVIADRDGGALAFRKGVARLRAGGIVALAGDRYTHDPEAEEVSLLGSPIRVLRGFASMARLGGARVVPVRAKWGSSGELRFEALQPLEPGNQPGASREQRDRAMVLKFMEVVDQSLRARPSEIDGVIFSILEDEMILRRRRAAKRSWRLTAGNESSAATEGEAGP